METTKQNNNIEDKIIDCIDSRISSLGYEVVAIETQKSHQRILRVFIDFIESNPSRAIGIEDCVKATRAIDEPLDDISEVQELFKGPYELEVSSPGLNRPLKKEKDFIRFQGERAKIHVYRSLSAEELNDDEYYNHHSKQKIFLGILEGFENKNIKLKIEKEKKQPEANLQIPLQLISKAYLDPIIDFSQKKKGSSI